MMKKRVLSFILCMVMVLTLFPGTALADSLPTMTVNLSGDTLFWDAVDGAVKYSFTVSTGGGFTTETSINLKTKCASYSAKSGSTKYTLYAVDENGRRITEIYSRSYDYTAQGTLATPSNIQWSGAFTVSWDAVEHAESYSVTL